MKFYFPSVIAFILSLVLNINVKGQQSGSFIVNGDFDKFYPVTFYDGGWDNNVATELAIGRSSVHTDASWRGSVMAYFKFHVTNWGHQSNFIDADVKQFNSTASTNYFIGGWRDASSTNSNGVIIIWLKGGTTTYYYHSNYVVNPVVYDGVQNALPYQETGGPMQTYKTTVDTYVNSTGISDSYTAYFNGTGLNYFNGNLGIGTNNTGPYKLAVEGVIGARKVKVTQASPWADYVFENDYKLPSLKDVEKYIAQNKHLSDVPSAKEVEEKGLDLGDNQSVLLKKIEELTLYIIDQNKKLEEQQKRIDLLEKRIELPPLKEVEKYIEQNKHLPDVPLPN